MGLGGKDDGRTGEEEKDGSPSTYMKKRRGGPGDVQGDMNTPDRQHGIEGGQKGPAEFGFLQQ
jgi:hypothetical protein